jgi:hypothetical protein
VRCNVRNTANAVVVEADEQIESGTSGGPIINDSGDLIGIASNFNFVNELQDKCQGLPPRPHRTLPVWVCQQIFGHHITQQK